MTRYSRYAWFAAASVGLLSVTLRPGATSVGPVLTELQAALGMSSAAAGVLTALPGICFAAAGTLAVRLAGRAGVSGGLAIGAAGAALGLIARSVVSDSVLFVLFTILALLGAGIGNILVPTFIKQSFPNRQAVLLSIYSVGLAVGATLPGIVESAGRQNWRVSLLVWGVLSAVAAVPWAIIGVRELRRRRGLLRVRSTSLWAMAASRKAVWLGVFFGIQSMHAYIGFGWFPEILRDSGVSASYAAAMSSLYAAWGLPAGLIMPGVVARTRDQRPLMWTFGLLYIAGYLGLWLAPTFSPALWMSVLGIAGFTFPTALMLITARTRDHRVTSSVSGFAQTIGYSLAAAGPFLVGWVHGLTHSWAPILIGLAAVSVLLIVAGLIVCAPGDIDDELAGDS